MDLVSDFEDFDDDDDDVDFSEACAETDDERVAPFSVLASELKGAMRTGQSVAASMSHDDCWSVRAEEEDISPPPSDTAVLP